MTHAKDGTDSLRRDPASLGGGLHGPAKPTDRLFFAVFPDAATAERIALLAQQLREKHRLHGKPFEAGRFHVTLQYLGDHLGLPQDIVGMAADAAAAVDMPAFDLGFDRASSFSSRPRNRPLVLRGDEGVRALTAFQRTLGVAMNKVGLGRWADGAYTPHVTLLYDDVRGRRTGRAHPLDGTRICSHAQSGRQGGACAALPLVSARRLKPIKRQY